MTNNQLAENSIIQLLSSVKLARDNAERADNRVDHSFYYALTIALEELQERRKADTEPYGFTDGDRSGMIYKPEHADRLSEPVPVYRHAQPAPVVLRISDEMTSEQAYEIGDYHGDPVDVFARGANWMRQHIIDSTLAAAPQLPGSEPATVPGKWIPVSERMPLTHSADCEYSDIEVNVFDGERVFTAHYATGSQPQPCGYWVDTYAKITHWQPLPAAPQEVKP
jgi:hypothetical protein